MKIGMLWFATTLLLRRSSALAPRLSIVQPQRQLKRATLASSRLVRQMSVHNDATSTTTQSLLSGADEAYMQEAIECAKHGFGHTFPNPAVGCVLVNDETDTIVGRGFHPRAGYPHAEIFALLQAAGHVDNGVQAAQAVVEYHASASRRKEEEAPPPLVQRVQELLQIYSNQGAPALFDQCLAASPVTAYVTLEPCCHYGQTPPCAATMVVAGVSRVVVGLRDPNPRVDGGGVTLLQTAAKVVDVVPVDSPLHDAAHDLVRHFVKRIAPYSPEQRNVDYDTLMTGAVHRALRARVNQMKSQGIMPEVSWSEHNKQNRGMSLHLINDREQLQDAIDNLVLPPTWMEHVDGVLWQHELVVLRLKQLAPKKAVLKRVGAKIAQALGAHVAQTLGHTVLLYRPAAPTPVLDLPQLVRDYKTRKSQDDGDDDAEAFTSDDDNGSSTSSSSSKERNES